MRGLAGTGCTSFLSFFHLRPDHRKLTLTDALRLIQDGGFERFFTERPSPRVTAKAVYYLSDQSEPGRGNTCKIYGTLSRFARMRAAKASPLSRDRAWQSSARRSDGGCAGG